MISRFFWLPVPLLRWRLIDFKKLRAAFDARNNH